MNCLIDTNIISEVRKGERCDPNVAAWYEAIDDDDLYLSVLILGEVHKGIARVRRLGDSATITHRVCAGTSVRDTLNFVSNQAILETVFILSPKPPHVETPAPPDPDHVC